LFLNRILPFDKNQKRNPTNPRAKYPPPPPLIPVQVYNE
jgi:hypothetical protein